jgi:uncharacterized membrane protein YdjX (TVP38/TMEM64 family)
MAITNLRQASWPSLKPLILLLLIGGLMLAGRALQLQQYLEKEHLRHLVAACGLWGPIVYLSFWLLVTGMFMPVTPLVLAGGVLFGPLWGEIYVLIGATAGATLSFLVGRYLAREWVAGKLAGTRLMALDEKVARQGWKIVALSRVIPIFPFPLVNSAFGLTRVSLTSFAVATFFGLFPVTMAYVYFSDSLFDLLQGKLSWQVILGGFLVALAVITPLVYKKLKAQPGEEIVKL